MSERICQGIGVSEGVRRGKAFLFKHSNAQNAGEDRLISGSEAESESARFDLAVSRAIREVDALIERSSEKLAKEELGVIKGQKSFLTDPAYCPEIRKLIREKLFSPEKAVRQVTENFAAIFENMDNSYMKERAADIRDAGIRLLDILSGGGGPRLLEIDSPVIVIADDLSPSDTVQLNKDFVLAFATQKGGKTSHTSIFAKSMGIPAVVGMPGIVDAAEDGDDVILDGARGLCIVHPQPDTVRAYEAQMEMERKQQELFGSYTGRDAVTKDGRRVLVAANIGSYADSVNALQKGAEAVGLFRTEQIYLSAKASPTEDAQFAEYKKIAECLSPREVIVRTLDIGGDKEVGYLNIAKEANPFLGYRAIRLCLGQKDLFLTQLRAILRASVYGKLAVMFPMISGFGELAAAKAALEEAKTQLRARDIPFDETIRTGIMIEIPSAALMADTLAKEVDFFSIGTNDLVQYTLAVDRGNEKVSYLYDYCDPAVLRLIRQVSDAAHANGIAVGMCGSMAGDPVAIPLLVGLGLDELSMAAGAIAQAKYVVSRIDTQVCRELIREEETCKSAAEVRSLLQKFYQSQMEK